MTDARKLPQLDENDDYQVAVAEAWAAYQEEPSLEHGRGNGKDAPGGRSSPMRSANSPATTTTQGASASQPALKLAGEPRILDRLAESLHARGVVGEDRAAKLIYLAVTSRLLNQPVSVILKGPSSVGKSFVAQHVVDHFPGAAHHTLTAMSQRALAYSEDKAKLKHRTLVVYEAAGLPTETGAYLLRSLVSEGRVRYETVEHSDKGKLHTRLIELEGPTNVLLTSTQITIHPENETRLLSVPINDSAEQTRAVMRSAAIERGPERDLSEWRDLQIWLETGEREVVIPYGEILADIIPPIAVRLRRDFRMLLSLVRSHALLHRFTRRRDDEGRIVATPEDYEVVRSLIGDLFSEGLELSVPQTVRERVRAVAELGRKTGGAVHGLGVLAARLHLDKGSTSRRVRHAIALEYLRNEAEKLGERARLRVGAALPEDRQVLPDTAALVAAIDRCSVAGVSGGRGGPSDDSEDAKK